MSYLFLHFFCTYRDVFSAFDGDIHTNAVDKPEMLPNLAWLINNINVGDTWPSTPDCEGGEINLYDIQGAVWKVVDDNDGAGTPYEERRTECIAEGIAAMAIAEGNNYELDCNDPNEQVPLVFIVDHDESGEILHQVIMSETSVSSIDGICTCEDLDDKNGSSTDSPKDTLEPSQAPSGVPITSTSLPEETSAPTEDDKNGSSTDSPKDTLEPSQAPSGVPITSTSLPEETSAPTEGPTESPATSAPTSNPKGSGSGDPHFKTWSGEK